ncbi:hypothetical protein [Geothrix sp. PMB-07]|uniref:hypothetical protein n=1 Tax=Geothrix sp. PMB-07 TaxID=3068640 RepID=UPI002741B984|nr:hypothetical protein [Geothrix sp. PMB-07]WLT31791.1 hypothetical protein Q9293_00370 [Geothrix sp. PMB-07]
MPLSLLALLAVVTFLIRFLPRCFRQNAIVSDTYYHLYCAELIRSRRFRLPPTLPGVLLKNEYTYPCGYHFLLALFPSSARAWVERATGAVFDTLILVIVYAASSWFATRGGASNAPWVALTTASLYAFAPALLRIGSGPRAYNGSARVPGQALFLTHILSAYVGWTTGHPAWLGVSVLAGAVLLFTATFSTQVFLLFGLGFTLLISPLHLLLMATCLLTSALITGGKTLHILRGRLAHSTVYFTHLQKIFLYPHILTFRSYLEGLRTAVGQLVRGEFHAFLDWYFHSRHYLHLLVTVFPQIVLFPLLTPWKHLVHGDARFLLVWAGCGVLWALLTKQKGLLFLGEGERYLEAITLPSLLLFTLGAWTAAPWLLVVLGAYSVLSAVYFVRDYLNALRPVEEDYHQSEALFDRLRQLPPGPLLPLGNVYWQALHRAPHPVLTAAMIDTRLLPLDELLEACGNYPYPGGDFHALAERYQVEYVLAERGGLTHYLLRLIKDSREFWNTFLLIMETPNLMLFLRKRTLEELDQTTRKALAENNLHAAREGLEAMLRIFPTDEALLATHLDVVFQMRTAEAPPTGDAFLLSPDWASASWEAALNGYLNAFHPEEPVALFLLHDESLPGTPTAEAAGQALASAIGAATPGAAPVVALLERSDDLLTSLRAFQCLHWVPPAPAPGEDLCSPFTGPWFRAACDTGHPAGPRPTSTALLYAPRWENPGWTRTLRAYLETFAPSDPVALILVPDPGGLVSSPPPAEVGEAVMQVLAETGRETFPVVILLDHPSELLDQLPDHPWATWLPKDPIPPDALQACFDQLRTAWWREGC